MDVESLTDKIYNIYEKKGYFSKYGGSLFMTILILIISLLIISYYSVMNKIEPIKNNWINERCNPQVLPFAGLINKPKDKSITEFTINNFDNCLNNTLLNIVDSFFQPIFYNIQNMNKGVKINAEGLNNVRKVFDYLRNMVSNKISEIMSRVLNLVVPVQYAVIQVKDALFKFQGVIVTFVYMVWILFNVLRKFFGIILIATVIALFIVVVYMVLAFAMWVLLPFIPFFPYIAGVLGVIFTTVLAYVLMMVIYAGHIYHVTRTYKVPKKPKKKRCFDENTIIELYDRTKKNIKDIKIGDKLKDGGIVTATFVLSSHGVNMYKFNNIIVSGTHRIYYNRQWKLINEIDESELIDDYRKENIYCLNTSTKRINIDEYKFLDWDELDELSMITFKSNARQFISKEVDYKSIHNSFDGGLIGDTLLELQDGTTKKIKDIKVNEILRNGGSILGKIIINGKNLDTISKFNIDGNEIIGGPNLFLEDDSLGKISTLDMVGEKIDNHNKLYHLITEDNYFKVNNINIFDYDSNIDIILGNNVETNDLL